MEETNEEASKFQIKLFVAEHVTDYMGDQQHEIHRISALFRSVNLFHSKEAFLIILIVF